MDGAATVTFSFDMVATFVDDAGDPGNFDFVPVGTSISISFSYDSSASLISTVIGPAGVGTLRRYDDPSLTVMLTVPGTGFSETFVASALGTGRLTLRDDIPDPDFGDLIDGLSLTLNQTSDPNVITSFGLIMRGPTLDLVNASGLPTSADPRWGDQRTLTFQICRDTPNTAIDCDLGLLLANVPAQVPVPASLPLAAIALLGVASVRRRRD